MAKTLKSKVIALTKSFIDELTEKEGVARYDAAFIVACGMMELVATNQDRDIQAIRELLGTEKAKGRTTDVSVGNEVDEDTFNDLCLNDRRGAAITILATPGTNTDKTASIDMFFGMSFYDPTHDHTQLHKKAREIVEKTNASDTPRMWIELDRVAELFHVKPECLLEECVKAALRRKQKEVAND